MDPRYNPQLKNLRTISPDIIRPPPGLRETADNTFGPYTTHHHISPSEKPPLLSKPKKRIISVQSAPLTKPRKRIISVEPAPPRNNSVQSTTKKKRIISVKPAPPKSEKNKSNGGRRRRRKSLRNKNKTNKNKTNKKQN